ncbi:MAG: hypothetical protein LQ341_002797 [Variospora aurantia]|nr:MAG: hypothetical protein LQ341_002797 [Variospora aurantia]
MSSPPIIPSSARASSKAPQSSQETQRHDLQGSQYPMVALRAALSIGKKPFQRPHDDKNWSILDSVEPQPDPPSFTPDSTDPSPDNPFRTIRQVRLFNCFKAVARSGIARFLYDECKEESQNQERLSSSWGKILRDRDDFEHNIELLLSMLPDPVIESLIKGTFAHDVEHVDKVKIYYQTYMRSSGYPGIYLNIIAYPKVAIGPQTYPGRWLSPRQVGRLCDAYLAYMDNSNRILNDAIDGQFGGKAGSRRWAENDRQITVGKAWIEEVRRQYCDNIAPNDMDKHHVKAPTEIGWALNVKNRIPQHAENSSTTPIFGYNNALTRLPTNKGGLGFTWKPLSAVLFPVWRRDHATAEVAEILGSLLTGSYWYLGGYNGFFAGGMKKHEDDDKVERWNMAEDNAKARLEYCNAPDELIRKFADISENLEWYKARHEDAESLNELKKQLREEKAKTLTLTATRKKHQQELQEKAAEHAKFQEDHLQSITFRDPEFGERLRRLKERILSSNRVDEEYRRRRGYGLLREKQPLNAEEEAKVEARMERSAKRAEEDYKEFRKEIEARVAASKAAAVQASSQESSQVSPPIHRRRSSEESPEL